MTAAVLLLVLAQAPGNGAKPPAPTPPPAAVAPRLVAPDSVPEHTMVRLKVDGDIDSAVFLIEPFEVVDEEPGPDGRSSIFTAPPGRYVVQTVTIKGAKLVKDRRVVVIEKAAPPDPTPTPTPTPGPTPNPTPPGPTPQPTPTPTPTPVTGKLTLSYVVPADPTPATAAIRTSASIRKALASLDAAWRTYSADEEDVRRLRLDAHYPAGGPPCLIVQDAAGKVLSAVPSPSEAAVISEANLWRGGK